MTAFGEYQDDETASCMKSRDYKDATDLIAQGADSGIIDRAAFNQGVNAKYDPFIGNTECCPSIVSRGPHATFHKSQEPAVVSWNGDTTPRLPRMYR